MNLTKSKKIIEGWRYQFDVGQTLKLFIQDWAFKHTGMYEPNSSQLQDKNYLVPAVALSQELNKLMLKGYTDPLSELLSEYCAGDCRQSAFVPTPTDVSKLIGELLESETKEHSLYEPCCGSGSITLNQLEDIYTKNIVNDSPLSHVHLTVEDISATACFSYVIQLVHKLEYLELLGLKIAQPKSITIQQIDVLSRKRGIVSYVLSPKD